VGGGGVGREAEWLAVSADDRGGRRSLTNSNYDSGADAYYAGAYACSRAIGTQNGKPQRAGRRPGRSQTGVVFEPLA
jgi:hypothetical protein